MKDGEFIVRTIDYITGGSELLEFVRPLWNLLNEHHQINSMYFSDRYRNFDFDTRKKKFMTDTNKELRIDLVKDVERQVFVGYCISTVTIDSVGEIDSLYIEPDYRKFGIGHQLMELALEWLESKHVKTKIIGVAEGNDRVFDFYSRYGFYKKTTILEQVKN